VSGLSCELSIEWLLSGSSVSISEYRCRKQDPNCGEEEQQPGHVIVFPRTGVFAKHIHGRTVVADPNHVVLFNADEVYRTSHPYGCGDHGVGIVLDTELIGEIIEPYDPAVVERPGMPFIRSHCPMGARAALLQSLLLRRRSISDPATPIGLEEMSIELAAHVVSILYGGAAPPDAPMNSATARAHRRLVEDTMGLLARRYSHHWSLPEIARELHTSPYHLCRLFRRHTGKSVHEYLTSLRLRAALEPLAEGERDLTRLALGLGYSSHSHFTSAFRREFGMPPSEVRRLATTSSLDEMSRILTAN
jgi:AraC family transcriptional regulator